MPASFSFAAPSSCLPQYHVSGPLIEWHAGAVAMDREVEVGIDGVCQADACVEVGRDELQRQRRARALSFAVAREVDLVAHGDEVVADQLGVAQIRVGLGDVDQRRHVGQ